MISDWFPGAGACPGAATRLFCFPHAGGGASVFAPWRHHLAPQIEVVSCHLPGHEERLRESAFEDLRPLLDALLPRLIPLVQDGRRFVLFGHSFGAWIAYAAALRLIEAGGPAPMHLIVSACRAPHVPPSLPPIHALPDSEFLREIQNRYEPLPGPILYDRELLAIFLRALRADFTVFETATWPETISRLSCPITACGGDQDPLVGERELGGWGRYTTADFRRLQFAGNHHFHRAQPRDLLRMVESACEKVI